MKFAAFISIIISVAVLFAACQGAVGPKGEKGDQGDPGVAGPKGNDGTPGADAPLNKAPQLKAGMSIGTQYFAFEGLNPDGSATEPTNNGRRRLHSMDLSTLFEDPEGVINLIYSLADLSDEDKKVVEVQLTGVMPDDDATDTTAVALDYTDEVWNPVPTHMKDGVTGKAYLAIRALKAGTASLSLTVKDGNGGMSTHDIPVMVKASNAPPTINPSVLTTTDATNSDAITTYAEMSRIGAMRIASVGDTTVPVPERAFYDPDGDSLKVTAEIVGDTATAHKEFLGVMIDASGNLVLMPKKGGPDTDIVVQITAADPYGSSVQTPITTAGERIEVRVNTPPMHHTYATSNLSAPAGKADTDKAVLADLATTTFSVAITSATGGAATLLTLANHFTDPDTQDNLTNNDPTDGRCRVSTSNANATAALSADLASVTIVGNSAGSVTVTVECIDTKMEMIEDSVTVTITQ